MENSILCGNCNFENSNKNLYCQNCGRPLISARPAPPPPMIPVQPPAPEPIIPSTPPSFPTPFEPVASTQPTGAAQTPPTPPPSIQPAPAATPIQGVPVTARKPPVTAPPARPKVSGQFQLFQLGVVVDAWMDVLPGKAEQGIAVADEFDRLFKERKVLGSQLQRKEVASSLPGEPGRMIHLVQSAQGESVVVYFGAQGSDLVVKWELHAKPQPNWNAILIGAGGVGLLTLVLALLSGFAGYGFFSFIFSWINRWYAWLFPLIVGGLAGGLLLRGNPLALFLNLPEPFQQDDLAGLVMTCHQCIVEAVEANGIDGGQLRAKRNFRLPWFRKI